MIGAAIGACELAFWVLLLGGLTARYVLGRARLGAIVLLCVPLVDVALCTVTAVDLANGTRADWTHGVAAAYLGFSVAFGPALIRSADRRFARRLADSAPARARLAPTAGRQAAEWRLWGRCLLACLVASAVLGALVLAGGAEQTRARWAGGGWFAQLGVLCGIWLVLGPGWTAARMRIVGSQGHRST